jgi:hypothetical protein
VIRVAGIVIVASVGLFAGQAHAARLTVALDYAAGPDCPEGADFRAVVIARLGYDPFVATAPDHVLVRIEPRGTTLHGRIEWRDASGRWTGDQTFPTASSDCGHLVRVIGFALAVEIQLLASADRTPAPDDAAPVESRAPAVVPAPQPIETPPVATRPPTPEASVASAANMAGPPAGGRQPTFAIGAGPAVGIGMSSEPVLLGRLFGALAWRRVSLELGAAVSLPATTRRPDGAGVSQQHLLGSAAACLGATRWSICLVSNAGEVRMAGEDIERPTSASVLLVEAGARAGINQRLGRRVLLRAYADGLVNLTRWRPTLDQVPVWTAPRFAAALGLDAAVSFP